MSIMSIMSIKRRKSEAVHQVVIFNAGRRSRQALENAITHENRMIGRDVFALEFDGEGKAQLISEGKRVEL